MLDIKFFIILFAVIGGFLAILSLPISGLEMFVLEVLLLGIYTFYLHKTYKIEYYYGMLMLKTQQGLDKIDNVADKMQGLWKTLADIGIVMSFGIFTLFLYKHISRRNFILGGIILFGFMFFIFPLVYPIAMSVISIPYSGSSSSVSTDAGINLLLLVISVATIAVGISFIMSISLIAQAISILISLYNNTFNGAVETVTPGVSLLLPGINLPFVEGIFALAILLFVHEFSHALLSRVAKIKLNSAGVLLFGFIPLGAFVDPDDFELSKSKKEEQGRVIVAGSTSNFILAFFSLILFISLIMLPFNVYDNGVTIIGVKEDLPLERGDIIYSVNGIDIESFEHFSNLKLEVQPYSNVSMVTNKGEFTIPTDKNGQVGLYYAPRIKSSFGWYSFLKNLFALLFSLNIFVGMVNLLPIPLFDGHHLLGIGLGDKNLHILKVINLIIIGAMLVNILPVFL